MAGSHRGKRLSVLERLGFFSCGRNAIVRKAGVEVQVYVQ